MISCYKKNLYNLFAVHRFLPSAAQPSSGSQFKVLITGTLAAFCSLSHHLLLISTLDFYFSIIRFCIGTRGHMRIVQLESDYCFSWCVSRLFHLLNDSTPNRRILKSSNQNSQSVHNWSQSALQVWKV